jgi:hypothetical protein
VLIPKPRVNLLIYHGILGARARERPAAVAGAGSPESARQPGDESSATASGWPSRRSITWAVLLRRIFEIDILACVCGARLRFVATIEDPSVVQRILRHLGLPTETRMAAPTRPPPGAGADLTFDFPS